MYVDVPTKVSAMELMSSPETPKSQILISPCELTSIFDGLMSKKLGQIGYGSAGTLCPSGSA
jgi:hypothetical protein